MQRADQQQHRHPAGGHGRGGVEAVQVGDEDNDEDVDNNEDDDDDDEDVYRWAMRMKADISFPVTGGGRVGVPSPGLYLVYAQVP